MTDPAKIEGLIATWSGQAGGAERKNFAPFLYDLIDALGLPRPGPGVAGKLGDYEFEGTIAGGSAKQTGAGGSADLYKRGCFVMEAKQSYLPPGGERAAGLFDDAPVIPLSPTGAAYDKLMLRAQGQAKNYAVNLPGDHPPVPFLIVCDVGRSFDLYFDGAGNGRGYGFFPDAKSYRIPLAALREPRVQALFQAIWTNPLSLDPKLRAAEVTQKVTRRLAEVSKALEASNRARARREADAGLEAKLIEETALFLMRMLFCMFAEDVGLLPEKSFQRFLEEAVDNDDYFENGLQTLWRAMNEPDAANRFSPTVRDRVRYFNGGLFEDNRVFALTRADRGELLEASKARWSEVEPAIFGTLLEQALSVEQRASFGAHYTPRAYVERLVDATVMEVLNADWAAVQDRLTDPATDAGAARTIAAEFHDYLARVRVLDPACGTGNFLYVAMEAVEALEAQVIEVRRQLGEVVHGRVTPRQFLGLEKNPRAAKIAELVLWIGWLRFRIRNDPDSIVDPVLERGDNINFGRPGGYDAVLDQATGLVPPWPQAEFIVGNPPFIGGKDLRAKLGGDYAEALWRANARVPKSADLVMQWWDRAAHMLVAPGTALRRFGFVTTNSITQSFSRRVIEGYLSSPERGGEPRSGGGAAASATPPIEAQPVPLPHHHPPEEAGVTGRSLPRSDLGLPGAVQPDTPPPRAGEDEEGRLSLVYAIPDHPWTRANEGSAAVRIAMTVAAPGAHAGRLVEVTGERRSEGDALLLDTREVEGVINADLTAGTNVGAVMPLQANDGLAYRGVQLMGAGFIVTPQEAAHLGLGRREGLDAHIRPYRHGRDLMQTPRGVMVIDLFGLTEKEVRQRFPEVYQHLLVTVKKGRDEQVLKSPTADAQAYAASWWIFGKARTELRPALVDLSRYIATVETSKHRAFTFLEGDVLPDNMLIAVGSDGAFHLGVLSSSLHTEWALVRGGTLEDRPRYNKASCFDPFPFPDPSPEQRGVIADLAEELDATRKSAIAEVAKLTMTELYNLRAKFKAGTLSPAERDRAVSARAGIVDRLHDQIDAAVAQAYGWAWPLSPAEIVASLVALNSARAAEEAEGHVRWLRPDYQIPRFAKPPKAAKG